MKAKYCRGRAYVRRMKTTDKSDSAIVGYRMAFLELLARQKKRKMPMVLVRHGFPNMVMAVERTRDDIYESFGPGRTRREINRFFEVE